MYFRISLRAISRNIPALKKADCDIALSCATDAARAAASIVLMTAGLPVIIDVIKESRKIFQRMNSYAIYRIAETLRVLLFMTLGILINLTNNICFDPANLRCSLHFSEAD